MKLKSWLHCYDLVVQTKPETDFNKQLWILSSILLTTTFEFSSRGENLNDWKIPSNQLL